MPKLIFATRPSALARWQTRWVIAALQQAHPGLVCQEKVITTRGDESLDKSVPEIGGKGLFTQELENELLSGAVHCAVHSLKDLPVEIPAGLMVAAIPVRAEVRDVLISADRSGSAGAYTLATLPAGARVGTSSPRRAAQVLAARPDVSIEPLRGNVDTRVRKVLEGRYEAIILAGAGVSRLGFDKYVAEWLPLDVMLPAPGQGALAIECRADDQTTRSLLAWLEDDFTRIAVTAERAFLRGLGGGCSVPVAAHGRFSGGVQLTGLVASLDGKKIIRVSGEAKDPDALGQRLAQEAIAQGAGEILRLVSVKS